MLRLNNADLIPILQTAIGPVILISGVGLILLTMTNRLGRTIDRARELADSYNEGKVIVAGQLTILWSRARLLRASILFAAMSALFSALLVIALFIGVLGKIEIGLEISGLFIGSMVSLIVSLFLFIRDINKSLGALKIELGPHHLKD